jgi:hypothetical protein
MDPSSAAISREVALAVGAMAVTPSNVLQVHNALQAESERLSAKLKLHQPALRVDEAGKDPVSGPAAAAAAFNAKIASLVDGCWAYIHALSDAAENLRATARDSGYTEEQIKPPSTPTRPLYRFKTRLGGGKSPGDVEDPARGHPRLPARRRAGRATPQHGREPAGKGVGRAAPVHPTGARRGRPRTGIVRQSAAVPTRAAS